MSSSKQASRKPQSKGKGNARNFVIVGILAVLVIGYLAFTGSRGAGDAKTASAGSDLVIPKSEVTGTVKFYPYKAGNTAMEVMAVMASDGTIRTALNTCQVCNGSPRAYYEQQGDVVVCQNCGNKFKMDMIEKEKGGCNPVPILKEDKTEDASNITISAAFLEANKGLFKVWKKQ